MSQRAGAGPLGPAAGLSPALVVAAVLFLGSPCDALADPFIDGVRRFEPGASAGFGAEASPGVVLGAPVGGGLLSGSVHVLSLGHGGSITLVFRDNVVFDGPGDDLVIFENPFHIGSVEGDIYDELALVEVSVDGREWVTFPFDGDSGAGLAGRHPVYASPQTPFALGDSAGGGDRFDLGELGLPFVRFVRIVDGGDLLGDLGNLLRPWGDKGGFDLDAVGAIHSSRPGRVVGSVSAGGQPAAGVRVKLLAEGEGRRRRRRSGADGAFRFGRIVPSGDYAIRARKKGLGRDEARTFVGLDQLRTAVALHLD